MSGEPKKSSKRQLALAIGRGVPIAKWARANKVARSTAFRWANDPKVRKAVQSCRRRVIDQAVGQMTKHSTRAAQTIAWLSDEGDSHTIRLKAARAVLSDMMKVAKFSGLEERMTEIEDKLDKRDAAIAGNVWTPGRTNLGYGNASTANP
jgi:phage terminase small subunit